MVIFSKLADSDLEDYYISKILMTTVTISSKYRVLIPKEIRDNMHLKPGQKLQVIQIGDILEFIPVRNIKQARGFLKGIDTKIKREEDR